jgi:hypothetical protein
MACDVDPWLGVFGGAFKPGGASSVFGDAFKPGGNKAAVKDNPLVVSSVLCAGLTTASSKPRMPITELMSSSSSDEFFRACSGSGLDEHVVVSGLEEHAVDSISDPEPAPSPAGKKPVRSTTSLKGLGVARPNRIIANLPFLRFFSSPSGHKWQ